MDTVTYPDDRVAAEIAEHFVPVKRLNKEAIDLMKKYNVRWLPGLVVADAQERTQHQWVGWLAPAEFCAELAFGRGQGALLAKKFDAACALFESIVHEWPDGERTPEAYYWWGVAEYRRGQGLASALPRWQELVTRRPQSQWSRKVAIYLPA